LGHAWIEILLLLILTGKGRGKKEHTSSVTNGIITPLILRGMPDLKSLELCFSIHNPSSATLDHIRFFIVTSDYSRKKYKNLILFATAYLEI
jgi:hypothetical protein